MEGVPQAKPKPEQRLGMSRRGFLATALNGAVAAGVGYSLLKHESVPDESPTEPIVEPEVTIVSPEALAQSETFERHAALYKQLWTLDRESVLFTDAAGAPVGEPVVFEDFIDCRPGVIACSDTEQYLYTPAEKNDDGSYVVEKVRVDWFNYVTAKHAKQHGYQPEELRRFHVTTDFATALAEDDEPRLQKGIVEGVYRTDLDIVNYFGDKLVRGAEHMTRREYVRQEVTFRNPKLSPLMKRELHQLLPALCAKESKFNDDVESSAGARGIAQFMPATVRGLGYDQYVREETETVTQADGTQKESTTLRLEQIPLTVQCEMLGRHFDNICNEVLSEEVETLLAEHIVPAFPDRASFERDFLTPCLINAYNPGGGTIRHALIHFCNAIASGAIVVQGGKDCFVEFAEFARASNEQYVDAYKDRSFEYTFHIYAIRELFEHERMKARQS